MADLKKDSLKFEGIYRGKVVDNDDPDRFGRIKVQIFGVFDNIEVNDLPWAVPATSLFCGSGVEFGYFAVPEIDSYVWCFFEAEDLYQPVYFAEALDGVHGLSEERQVNYPHRRVIKTKNGIYLYIDDLEKEIKLYHPNEEGQAGTYVLVDKLGNVTVQGREITLKDLSGNYLVKIAASGDITVQGKDVVIQGDTVNINPEE